MMRQYLGVKAAHPHAVVLFRMGDFFETFYEDAKTCAELLDLTLTARSKERDPVPMAGVPHHAIDGYVARLIDFGKTVVLVDQVEDPRQAKGLVRREVTRVVTPGTFVDPSAPARVTTYLVALHASEGRRPRFGLSALDLSTGDFRATSTEDEELLIEELERLEARELLIADRLRSEPLVGRIAEAARRLTITPLSSEEAGEIRAREALVTRLGEEEVGALGLVLGTEALIAAGMTLAFAERTQLGQASFERKAGGSLGHVVELKPYLPGDALILDHEARAHLELFRASGDGGRKGSLLGAIDEAVTPMGGRLIARWLSRPLIDVSRIAERQDAVSALVAAPRALDRLRGSLREIYDLERLLARVTMGRSNPRDLGALRTSLERLPEVLGSAADAEGALGAGRDDLALDRDGGAAKGLLRRAAEIDRCADVGALIASRLADDPPAELGAGRVFKDGVDAELDRLLALSKSGKDILAEIERRERDRTGISSLKVRFNRVFGYFIEITRANLKSVPSDYIRKQTTAQGERFYTPELKKYEEQILHADERRLERETQLFGELVREVAASVRRLKRIADAVAELDVLGGLAHLAERRGWRRPSVDGGERIEISDGRHPVLEAMAGELGEPFVPNDLSIGGEQRLLIITGPNMAGKSTIMRQTALLVILAQMGSFVPAGEARVGVVDRIFTRVGASDDLSRGRSTFMVEMAETARILRSATPRSLILLDEIGRGTSTFDGLSIAWAVAEHLHDSVRAKTLFATHYHELTEIVREKTGAANWHVAVKEWNEKIIFLRKLQPGPTNRSYGVQVARLAGLPRPVVERARRVLDALEAQDLRAGPPGARAAPSGAGQLSLFTPAEAVDPERAAVLEELREVDLDGLTPREALARLAEWQARLSRGPG
ncbi:MAG: DNA mismatch repair protein MutS [Deltaproteobacteria bacterium]|nr:DNA mismatch repair protein MutS [Deltaproteobacteria bacterium]